LAERKGSVPHPTGVRIAVSREEWKYWEGTEKRETTAPDEINWETRFRY